MHDRPDATAPRVTLLYQFFHPDDVISARLFADLAVGLTARGWQVTAAPANRSCEQAGRAYPLSEEWAGGRIRRVWRPDWRRASGRGRVLNAAWMVSAWAVRALFGRRPRREVVVIGTDPVLAVLTALPWRLARPRSPVAHWCFDLYPEAAVADGLLRADGRGTRLIRRLLTAAYRRCGLIADLGPCMAARLAAYGSRARTATLTPWALVEPPAPVAADPATRTSLFGPARLGLLYSGNFGRAHGYEEFLALARRLRNDGVGFCFAGRGGRVPELRAAVGPDDTNVTFAGFAPEAELERRLGACDLHLVSLRPEWTGTVVPSKFFGALATGRGVLFSGSPDSAIARWVRDYRVGWVVTPETVDEVAGELRALAAEPGRLAALRDRCHAVYHELFARERQLDRWDTELRSVLDGGRPASGTG